MTVRTRPDLCPGVLRPWPAPDGPLVRIRLVGGLLTRTQLEGLLELARDHGDGNLHLTKRANVQIRAVTDVVALADALESLGLLPSRTHELVRNIVVSPAGSLHPLAEEFDRLLCATPELAGLPARFLFGFDDRGDLSSLGPDLGVCTADSHARLVIGGRLGEPVVPAQVPERLVELAQRFLEVRGEGPSAAWRVAELPTGSVATTSADYGGAPDTSAQVDVPDGLLTPALAAELPDHDEVVVTPWHGLVLR